MTPNRNARSRGNPPRRPWLGLALTLLATAALLSSGFVRERIAERRSRRGRLKSRLELESATDRRAGRPPRWQSRRHRRRARGQGWSAGQSIELLQQSFAFGGDGKDVTSSLSQAAVNATMSRYNQELGSCLIKHGANDVTINFQIQSTGRVSVVTSSLAGAAARCVKNIVLRVRFPARRGTKTIGRYELRLR
ncbi:MAG: hypothetical protein ABI333_02675 [bacterium]